MRHVLGYALGFVVLLAGVYAGSYYAMLDYESMDRMKQIYSKFAAGSVGAPPAPVEPNRSTGHPIYRIGGDAIVTVFRPWHHIDIFLRPDFWETQP